MKQIKENLRNYSSEIPLNHPITNDRLDKLTEFILKHKSYIRSRKPKFKNSSKANLWEKLFLKLVLKCSDSTLYYDDIDDVIIKDCLSRISCFEKIWEL